MKFRWVLYMGCWLPLLGWTNEAGQKNEVEAIEQKIQALKKSLKQDRFKEMDDEVKGQGYMIADWDAFSKEIGKIRQDEVDERRIEDQIRQLEQEKERLQQQLKQGTR